MSYTNNAKNRRLKRKFTKIINFLKFSWLNLNTAQKLSIIWIIIWFISLFLNWINSVDNTIIWNVFNKTLWITWYIFIIIYIIILSIILSKNKVVIVKNILNIGLKNSLLIIILSFFSLLLVINSAYIINWLSTFKEWIYFWNWVIFSIISSIFLILWSIIEIRSKENIWIFTKDYEDDYENIINKRDENIIDEKNNMKLPF